MPTIRRVPRAGGPNCRYRRALRSRKPFPPFRILGFGLALLLVWGCTSMPIVPEDTPPRDTRPAQTEADLELPSRGPADAPVTMTVFEDYQ